MNSYSNTSIQSYNTIYSIRTYHIYNNAFLKYSWSISSNQLTAISTNSFLWVGFSYLILQFITCPSNTPYLMLSTSLATAICYDLIPAIYYADEYSELQKCLYYCYQCTTATACTTCNSTTDFRVLNKGTSLCDPMSGYYESNVTVTTACVSLCKTCSFSKVCITCITGYQLSNSTCKIICTPPCATCSASATTCLGCIGGYQLSGAACVFIPTTPTNCGDGVLDTGEACDDGNLDSNDGCDAICQVEPYYTCASAPSVCNIASFSPYRVSFTKSTTANEFTLVYQLQPSGATAYSTLTWSSIVSQQSTLGVSKMGSSFDTSNGQLTLQYSYTQDLNDNTLVLGVAFPNTAPFVNIQGATIT